MPVGQTVRRLTLTAGNLTLELDGADLRHVTWGSTEVLQRVYYAVRDAPWNTVPGRLISAAVEEDDEGFRVAVTQEHVLDEINVLFEAVVEGRPDGTLTYRADSLLRSAFSYSKIGLNLHHGLDTYRGKRLRAQTLDGPIEGRFKEPISPQLLRDGSLTAMFPHMDGLKVWLGEVTASFSFEGDRFEMQDHRNWCDANWKSYGTPLEYGFPRDGHAGERLHQVVTLRMKGEESRRGGRAPKHDVRAVLCAGPPGRLPEIGVTLNEFPDPVVDQLAKLGPSYVRLAGAHLPPDDAAAGRVLQRLNVPLELTATVPPDAPGDAAMLAEALVARDVTLRRLIVLAGGGSFSAMRGATPPELVTGVVAALAARRLRVPVASGTGQFYNVINRDRPEYPAGVGIAFAANPQVHAFDDESLMENARAFPEVVHDCHRLYPDRAVVMSPVQLVAEDGPFPGGPAGNDGGRPQDDPRYGTPFAAAWTVAVLAALTGEPPDSFTLFDAAGPRGLLAFDGAVRPAGALLRSLRGLHGAQTRTAQVSSPNSVAVLDVSLGDRRVVVVANLQPSAQSVLLSGATDEVTGVRFIDDLEPEGSVTVAGVRRVSDGVSLVIRAYGVAVLDTQDGADSNGRLA